jgi:protein CpxP
MSLKNKLSSIFTIALAVVAFSAFSFAQEAAAPAPDKDKGDHHHMGEGKHGGKGFGHRRGGMMRMLHGLNLTDAQKTQIKAIMETNKPNMMNREEMRSLHEAKRNGTLTADQQAQLEASKAAMKAKMQSVHEQILAVLTVEQKAQLEQKKAEMKQRREEFRKNHPHPAPAATTETSKEN